METYCSQDKGEVRNKTVSAYEGKQYSAANHSCSFLHVGSGDASAVAYKTGMIHKLLVAAAYKSSVVEDNIVAA